MKTLFKTFAYAAIAALALSSCAKEKLQPADELTGKLVTVHFGTENTDPSTKATLTPDAGETAFQAAWENKDQISIEYISPDAHTDIIVGTWDATNKKFSASLPNETGSWEYSAAYPVPSASDNSVDFGANRTQKGNVYNSKYDIMIGAADTKNSAAGKDDNGNDIVFPMTRQTAIAYFHFTSDIDESLVSATLKVKDGAIANSAASISKLFKFVAEQANDLTEINLTFEEGTAPSAKDFQLWFNVLPTSYSSMTLTVETATKTFTISKKSEGLYEAGKLYKVIKKNGIAWTDKGGSSTPVTNVSVVNVNNVNAVKEMGNGSYGDYKDKVQTITVDGLEYSMTNICANSKDGTSGYMMAAKQFIQMKKSTSYILNTKSGVTKIKAWVLPKTTDAISVYQGSTSDNISTLINKPNKTTETVKLISYSDSEVDTQLDIYEYTITDGFFKLSPSSALWLYKLEVTYSNSGSSEPAPDTYTVSCATVTGGTLSATPASAKAGTEISLTATPDAEYTFNKDWTVTNAETSETIYVKDGKFTMPAANVNVSASFTQKTYTITANAAENGTYTVKVGDTEVTSAVKGDKVVLEATPDEGYLCDRWTVVDAEGKNVSVSNNSFYMPSSNVTISTSFSLKPEDITFNKVTSSLTDYSGEYLMLHSNDYVVSGVTNKKLATVALEPNVGDQIMESDIPASAAVLTIEASTTTGYYTIKFSDGKYLGWSSSTDFSTYTEANTDNYLWSISITNSSATISNKKDETRIIKWYASKNEFRPYTTKSYDLPVLYKKN